MKAVNLTLDNRMKRLSWLKWVVFGAILIDSIKISSAKCEEFSLLQMQMNHVWYGSPFLICTFHDEIYSNVQMNCRFQQTTRSNRITFDQHEQTLFAGQVHECNVHHTVSDKFHEFNCIVVETLKKTQSHDLSNEIVKRHKLDDDVSLLLFAAKSCQQLTQKQLWRLHSIWIHIQMYI